MHVKSYIRSKVDAASIFGFIIPLVVALLLGLLLHAHYAKPLANPAPNGSSNGSGSNTVTNSLPSGAEIAAANAAILAYCTNDLRQDTSCELVSGSNVTAPGFVESGVSEAGTFEGVHQVNNGVALAKGNGTNWSVLWLGQGCIPQNIASSNNVPNTFSICAS